MLVTPKNPILPITSTLLNTFVKHYILTLILSFLNTPYHALTPTYIARHTWESVAQAQRVPIDLISEGMGHDSVQTTKIYLASLDTSEIDRVNNKMIKSIKKK